MQMLRKKEILKILGTSSSTLDRWINAGQFPPKVRLGPNIIGWPKAEIEKWLKNKRGKIYESEQ